jgi:acetoin utilization deacetylase AcuC-like enzyme
VIPIVHHPAYVAPAPARSTYRWNKNGLIRDLLVGAGTRVGWHQPEPMPLGWLEAVHDPDYVAEVMEARVPPAKTRRIGFPVTPEVARRAQAVPGGTWLAGRLALAHGFAANTAGGSHHALADTGAGYCVFNDLALAAVRLVEEGEVERIAVVDCDVHQGDGTADCLSGTPDLFTLSIHAEKNYPTAKITGDCDVGLPDGVEDAGYLAVLEAHVGPLLDAIRPDIVFYNAGVDPHRDDRLGRLALTDAGLLARDRFVVGAARRRGIPFVGVIGGGYATDIDALAGRHALVFQAMSEAAG